MILHYQEQELWKHYIIYITLYYDNDKDREDENDKDGENACCPNHDSQKEEKMFISLCKTGWLNSPNLRKPRENAGMKLHF